MKRFARILAALLLPAAALASPVPAAPPDPEPDETVAPREEEPATPPERITLLEELVVLGTDAIDRRDPATFTDVGREEIERRNRGQDLGMLLADTPNAFAYSDAGNGTGYSYLRLRGFDQTRISVQINGVPLNTPESHQVYYIDLADFAGSLDRIQVQRGAGTALHGSPAVGGVVNLDTGDLGTVAGGELALGAGSFGTTRVAFRYGDSFADGRWAWMVRGARVTSDGYRVPSWTRHGLLHFALQRYGASSIWKIHLFGGPEKTQLAYFGVPAEYLRGEISGDPRADRRTNFLRPGEIDKFFQPHLQIIHSRRLAPGLFLQNTWYTILGEGFFRQFSDTLAYDPMGTEPPTPEYPERELADVWRKRWIRNRQFGWIPRLTWNHPGGALTAGMELMFHTGHHRGTVQQGSVCDPDCGTREPLESPLILYDYRNRKNTYTAFVRESVQPTPNLAVNLELQATRHEFRMRDDRVRGFSFDSSFSFVTPRLGVNWNVDDRWNVYAQVSTARSEPSFSNVWDPQDVGVNPETRFGGFDPSRRRFFDPGARAERMRSYEAGVGYTSTKLRWKANLYHMDFRDEFVFAGGIDDDGLPITTNAARSVHQGVEIEASGSLPGQVEVSGHAAYSQDELRDHRILSSLSSGGVLVVNYTGNRVPLFPEYLLRVRASRGFGPVRLEIGARRVGRMYTDASENERRNPAVRAMPGYVDKKIEPYTLVDLTASWDLGKLLPSKRQSLVARLHVDNLLDGEYAGIGYSYPLDEEYTAFYTEFFPVATRSFFFGITYGF